MRPTKTSGSHTSAKFTESGIRCITYAPRCISNVSHMPHLEKFIRDETNRIYPRYLDQIPLFGQTRAIGCRHLRALDCHSSARIRGSRLKKRSIFISWLFIEKKNEKKIEAPTRSNILPGNERTSSADSARSAVCNSPQSKSAAPPSSELNARAIGKCTYLPTYPPT